jgi:Ca2+-binding EF-hand superfamily protein
MTLRRSVLPLLNLALLTALTASGAAQPLNKRAVVQSADTNNDSRIDRVEFHHRTTEAFFLLDTNKDGSLVPEEIVTGVQEADPEKIKAADGNEDGQIDIHEYHNALSQDFNAADTNSDGVLDTPEVEGMGGGAAR